jgi:hypothetical protein
MDFYKQPGDQYKTSALRRAPDHKPLSLAGSQQHCSS